VPLGVPVPLGEGAPPLCVTVGVATGDAVALALPDGERVRRGEGEGEGAREGEARAEAVREGASVGSAVPDACALRDADADAVAVPEELALREGAAVRDGDAPTGDAVALPLPPPSGDAVGCAEGEGAPVSDGGGVAEGGAEVLGSAGEGEGAAEALPSADGVRAPLFEGCREGVGGPLGVPRGDCDTVREGAAVRDCSALPLGEGEPVGDPVGAALPVDDGDAPGVREGAARVGVPPPALPDSAGEGDAPAEGEAGGEGERAPVAVAHALALTAGEREEDAAPEGVGVADGEALPLALRERDACAVRVPEAEGVEVGATPVAVGAPEGSALPEELTLAAPVKEGGGERLSRGDAEGEGVSLLAALAEGVAALKGDGESGREAAARADCEE
jgi:hypothetical protein